MFLIFIINNINEKSASPARGEVVFTASSIIYSSAA
jgi:hypothetical protein